MNYLQLCQRLRQECGISGDGPVTTVNQTGQMKIVCDWVNQAWMDIQTTNQDWGWMRTQTSFPTVAGQATYNPATDIGLTDFGMWARDSFRVYNTSAGTNSECFIAYMPYDGWRNTYLFGANRATTAMPAVMAIAPDKALCFGPITEAGYTILGDYFKAPSELSGDADIPELPTQFHMAIVYRAMMFYAAYENASEVYQQGQAEFSKMMMRLMADRIPEVLSGGALA